MSYIFNIADSIAAVYAIDYIHKVSPLYKMTYIIGIIYAHIMDNNYLIILVFLESMYTSKCIL